MFSAHPLFGCSKETSIMTIRTCAACDCELDGNPIQVTIRGRTVEVCCDDCATKLKEADRFGRSANPVQAGG
jgi:ribosome-binding protein aMBF1 (putative translation factor)